jgi:hypothetical protein
VSRTPSLCTKAVACAVSPSIERVSAPSVGLRVAPKAKGIPEPGLLFNPRRANRTMEACRGVGFAEAQRCAIQSAASALHLLQARLCNVSSDGSRGLDPVLLHTGC